MGRAEDDMTEKTSLFVVVPAFNEAETIEATIKGLHSIEEKLASLNVELSVCVVDDGSTDDTGKLAKEAGCDYVLRHRTNQGLGAGVRSGLEAARKFNADLAVKVDADGQHEPSDIVALIAPILEDTADIVYGSRFERIEYKMPIVRRLGNFVFTALMRMLTGWPLRDSQPGMFAVHKEYFADSYLPGNYNYTQQILLNAYHQGLRFAHVPVAFNKRKSGKSFVSLRYPLKVLPQILMVLIGVRPLMVFGSIGSAFILLSGSIFIWQFMSWLLGVGDKPVENPNLVLGLGLFGVQTLFFGFLAHLVVELDKRSRR